MEGSVRVPEGVRMGMLAALPPAAADRIKWKPIRVNSAAIIYGERVTRGGNGKKTQ